MKSRDELREQKQASWAGTEAGQVMWPKGTDLWGPQEPAQRPVLGGGNTGTCPWEDLSTLGFNLISPTQTSSLREGQDLNIFLCGGCHLDPKHFRRPEFLAHSSTEGPLITAQGGIPMSLGGWKFLRSFSQTCPAPKPAPSTLTSITFRNPEPSSL